MTDKTPDPCGSDSSKELGAISRDEWMRRATLALMGYTGQPEDEAREDMEILGCSAAADDNDPEWWVEEKVFEIVTEGEDTQP